MAFPQVGSDNLNANTILCDIYNGIQSILPLALAPEVQNGAAQVTWALDKLASVGLSNTILGCAPDSLSPLYPNATSEGGPLNPPPSVVENAGDNVYNKVYFTEAPTKPQCDATA